MSEIFIPIQTIEPYVCGLLEKGRRDWDIKHTRAVVYYTEQLAPAVNIDSKVLITAAWLHDIGWSTLQWNEGHETEERMRELKKLHMTNGEQLALSFLNSQAISSCYTPKQIERIAHLVGMHDDPELINKLDEVVLWEADTLGQIDIHRITPTFGYLGGLRTLQGIENKRQPKFQTALGKQFLAELLPAYSSYINTLK